MYLESEKTPNLTQNNSSAWLTKIKINKVKRINLLNSIWSVWQCTTFYRRMLLFFKFGLCGSFLSNFQFQVNYADGKNLVVIVYFQN